MLVVVSSKEGVYKVKTGVSGNDGAKDASVSDYLDTYPYSRLTSVSTDMLG